MDILSPLPSLRLLDDLVSGYFLAVRTHSCPMTRTCSSHPFVFLALLLAFSFTPLRAQESSPTPTAENYLKIINEQIGAMSNKTFELSNSELRTNVKPASTVSTVPTFKTKVHFSSLSNHRVALIDAEGKPYLEHITYPDRGNFRILHRQKEFITDVKNPTGLNLADSLLPLTFVEKYRRISSGAALSPAAWVLESQTPEQATIALHVDGKVRMRATFAIPGHMCTTLRIYDGYGQELEVIEAVLGRPVTNLPFLASRYKRSYNGRDSRTGAKTTFVTYCDTVSTTPVPFGALKPPSKPQDYQQLTEEETLKRTGKRGSTNQVPSNVPARDPR